MKQCTIANVAGALITFGLVFGVATDDAQSRICTAYTKNLKTGEQFRTTYPCGETIKVRLERERADWWAKRLAEKTQTLRVLFHVRNEGFQKWQSMRPHSPKSS